MNALLAFESVARTGSVKAASAEMLVTAGAVSHQLRQLEEHFGVPLFIRQGRGLALTTSGAAFFERVATHFDGLRQASAHLLGNAGRSVLRLRSYTTFATRWLIPRISKFQLAHPEIDVRLTTASEWSELGDFDVGIRLGKGDWPQYDCTRLVSNILVPVSSPALIRPSRPADVDWLAEQTILVLRARPDDWSLWCGAAGIDYARLSRRRELESSVLAYQAAIEGQGVALAQKVLVESEVERQSLVVPLPIEVDQGDYTYYLVSDRESRKERLISLLRCFLLGGATSSVGF
ncbi:LysR substrate-binding domain-containing protein [Tardiphaga sp.]|jgi:LysR family glycine cleavage system transcriptional activator|uniref:LysR substrate-binding domain-containing protein n=1 Tax=Tardiphaga sp. TaxID=1926292 RepID=UPI0037DA34FA